MLPVVPVTGASRRAGAGAAWGPAFLLRLGFDSAASTLPGRARAPIARRCLPVTAGIAAVLAGGRAEDRLAHHPSAPPRDPLCCLGALRQAQTCPGKRDARDVLPGAGPRAGTPTAFPRHSLARRQEPVCRTRGSCSKVGREGPWLFT